MCAHMSAMAERRGFTSSAWTPPVAWPCGLRGLLTSFANMNVQEISGIHYTSSRQSGLAEFRAKYGPVKPVELRRPGSLEHWLSERYCLYTVNRGAIYRAEIHHAQ